MKKMTAHELKRSYIDFFVGKDHCEISSASLVPENDASVLFTTAGMHPLVPYLLGESHPKGKRLVDSQKCVRTVDIFDVGDKSHLTFFEMLGNWSLGDYFKEESIAYSFEYLTKVLEIPIEKLAVTVFAGDDDAPRDEASAKRWEELGILKENIYYLPKKYNWWWAGETGPCGPDTEIFYIFDQEKCCEDCSPACDCGKYMEIWNNVFMEFEKTAEGIKSLSQKNVDTGMGFERILTVSQNKSTVYETELFSSIMDKINSKTNIDDEVSKRIIADHLRASVMMVADTVRPSNVDRGYILRRLIRRSVRNALKLEISDNDFEEIIFEVIDTQKRYFQEVVDNEQTIKEVILEEVNKFKRTLIKGEKKLKEALEKTDKILSKEIVFHLYDTYGFPPELTMEIAKEENKEIDYEGYLELFKEHQEKSRAGATNKFKGGLKSNGYMEVKYHTATHLLNAALKEVLGSHVHQMGSNITEERLRFDFPNNAKLTKEEIQQVEDIVNQKIKEAIDVTTYTMTKEEAINLGCEAMFIDKYDDVVNVYMIGDFSKEICGGPHVKNTSELGTFKIVKEESSSSGVRRIKAILE